jgi:hypothetical protein
MSVRKTLRILGAGALACCAPSLFGAITASMDLTSAGSDLVQTSLGWVYVGPYTALVNGVSTSVICDDFVNDSYIPELWTADVYTAPNSSTQDAENSHLVGTALTQAYNEVGYLASLMLNASNPTTIGEIDFALWNVFDPGSAGAISTITNSTIQSQALMYYHQALAAVAANPSKSYISQFAIYSPDTSESITCAGQGCSATDPPQEFLVKTPEPPEVALLGVDLSSVGLLCLLLSRRRAGGA